MCKRFILIFVLLPTIVLGQTDSIITKLLNGKNAFYLDSTILSVSDTNRRNKANQLQGVWRSRSSETGRLTYIATYLNGKRHGHSVGIFPNGRVATSTYYEFDIEVGPGLEFWQNGHLRSIRYFNNGKVEGVIQAFDTLGRLIRAFEIKDGHKQGHEIVFYPSGNIQIITKYLEGLEDGLRREYPDVDGLVLEVEYEVKNGVPIVGRFYENGILTKIENYR